MKGTQIKGSGLGLSNYDVILSNNAIHSFEVSSFCHFTYRKILLRDGKEWIHINQFLRMIVVKLVAYQLWPYFQYVDFFDPGQSGFRLAMTLKLH